MGSTGDDDSGEAQALRGDGVLQVLRLSDARASAGAESCRGKEGGPRMANYPSPSGKFLTTKICLANSADNTSSSSQNETNAPCLFLACTKL